MSVALVMASRERDLGDFVSFTQNRTQEAKEDWREQRLELVRGESDFIPLPKN